MTLQEKIITLYSQLGNLQHIKELVDNLKKDVLEEMESQGLTTTKLDIVMNHSIECSIIDETEKICVDTAKLKKDYAKVYNECFKITKVKKHLTVKTK